MPDILNAKANTDVNDGITDAFETVMEKALSGGLEFGFADGSGFQFRNSGLVAGRNTVQFDGQQGDPLEQLISLFHSHGSVFAVVG